MASEGGAREGAAAAIARDDDGAPARPVAEPSEKKAEGKKRKKKRKRCRNCRARLPVCCFSCSGCGLTRLCLRCSRPKEHGCPHDWDGEYRERLRRDNPVTRPGTLRDRL